MIKIISLLAALSVPAQAATVSFVKKVNPAVLHDELIGAGFAIEGVRCDSATRCRIVLLKEEKKDPRPVIEAHVYLDPEAGRKRDALKIRGLAAKLKNSTASAADRDELLILIASLLAGQ